MSASPLPSALRDAITRALRAPSSHNSQPWRLQLRGSQLELRADFSRRLDVVDPAGRELTISCGAALFSLRVALEHAGFQVRLEHTPAPADESLLARLQLEPAAAAASSDAALHEALWQRQTRRGAFLAEPLPERTAERLTAAAASDGVWLQLLPEGAARASLAALVAQGDGLQWQDSRFRRELASWMRPNDSPRGDGLAGHTVGLGKLTSRLAPWVIRRFDSGASEARKDAHLVREAPLVALLATAGDARADWLAAGQALQRLLLTAATLGVSAGFLNQPLQCASLRPRVSALLERPGHAQLVLRFGRAHPGLPSARRPLAEVLEVG